LQMANRELHVLLRRGWISLLIGLAFLGMLLALSEVVVRQMIPGPRLRSCTKACCSVAGWLCGGRSNLPLRLVAHSRPAQKLRGAHECAGQPCPCS
jgi:hypothetical protein